MLLVADILVSKALMGALSKNFPLILKNKNKMEVKSAQSIKDEAERKFERMHISRTLDTFKRNFSKRIPKIIDQHLSKLKVEIQLMANQMELGEMKQFSTHLEDYLFDFEDDFTEFLDEHIETVKESIRSPLSYDTDEYFSETDSDAFFQINSGYFFNNKDAVNRKKNYSKY